MTSAILTARCRFRSVSRGCNLVYLIHEGNRSPRLRLSDHEHGATTGLFTARLAVGAFRIEGEFDANLMRLTPEVERWVEGLREIDRRLEDQARENPPTDVWEGVGRIERELTALRRSFCAEAATRG